MGPLLNFSEKKLGAYKVFITNLEEFDHSNPLRLPLVKKFQEYKVLTNYKFNIPWKTKIKKLTNKIKKQSKNT